MSSHEPTAPNPTDQKTGSDTRERVHTDEFYRTLAKQAFEAGQIDLYHRYSQFARDIEFEDPTKKEAYIKNRVDETIAAVQLLTAWGEEAVERQGADTQFGGVRDEEKGILLYSSVRRDVAEPVLEQVYQQLGVTQQRLGAIPSATGAKTIKRVSEPPIEIENEVLYGFQTSWGINLVEEQTIYKGGSVFYELWGRKPMPEADQQAQAAADIYDPVHKL